MSNDRATFSRLLDTILDLPPEERAKWVDALPSEHASFKPRLHALIARAAQIETSDFLGTLPKLDNDESSKAGDTLGPYRLVREIGSGGMGTVWLAERNDGALKRAVALKFLRAVGPQQAFADRLQRERDILAELVHPGIARLYDAGIGANGVPYLALEYIEGEHIDEYCRSRNLDVRTRVGLVMQVARAVAYAHGKLVVHRDLKPANILVSADRQTHLLDFSIAKLLEDGRAIETKLTQMGGRALTPEYASPEQILSQPITTATDVYSLGVILYELLTGSRPYTLKRESRGALEDAIVEAEPERPSERVTDPALARALRGDLDAIVLKALKKLPHERYSTMAAFADDLSRYLDGHAVLAQPDRVWYRARKFVGRNRLATASAAAVLIAVVTGAGTALWQAQLARAEQRRAEDVKAFIASIFSDANPYQQGGGRVLTGVELLRISQERLQQLDDVSADVRLELTNVLGESLTALEDAKSAESVLVQGLHETEEELGANDPQVLRAKVLLAQSYRLQDKPDEARELLDIILPMLRANSADHPDILVAGLRELTSTASRLTEGQLAEQAATEALAVIDSRLGGDTQDKITVLTVLYSVYRARGDIAASLDAIDRAYSTAQRLYAGGEHPAKTDAHFYYAIGLNNAGRTADAAREMRLVLQQTEQLLGSDSRKLGMRLSSTYFLFTEAGFLAEGVANAQRGLEILAEHVAPDSRIYAAAQENLALAELDARRGAGAARLLKASADHYRREFGETHQYVAITERNRAHALVYAGEMKEAEAAMATSEAIQPTFPKDGFAMNAYIKGLHQRMLGNLESARALQEHALSSIWDETTTGEWRSWIRTELALIDVELGRYDAAEALLEQVLSERASLQERGAPRIADAWVGLARVRMADRDFPAALELLIRADAFWRELEQDNRWAGEAALWLGRCYLELDQPEKAREALTRAAKILATSKFPVDRSLVSLARQG